MPKNGIITSLGILAIVTSLLFFPLLLIRFPVIRSELVPALEQLAYASFLLMLVGLMGVAYGIVQFVKRTQSSGAIRSVKEMILHILSASHNVRIFTLATVGYALFYSLVSSTLAFRPWEAFSEQYGATIPSVVATLCCGQVGQIPRFTIYLTEHIGVLVIPINILLISLVAPLVGINAALAAFSYRQTLEKSGGRWVGLGAFIGVFTACPSCAMLFFVSGVGGVAALSLATSLAYFQALFIGITLPVLILTPYFISRNILKAYGGECPIAGDSDPSALHS